MVTDVKDLPIRCDLDRIADFCRDPRITLAQIRYAAEKARTLCAAHTLDSLFLG